MQATRSTRPAPTTTSRVFSDILVSLWRETHVLGGDRPRLAVGLKVSTETPRLDFPFLRRWSFPGARSGAVSMPDLFGITIDASKRLKLCTIESSSWSVTMRKRSSATCHAESCSTVSVLVVTSHD